MLLVDGHDRRAAVQNGHQTDVGIQKTVRRKEWDRPMASGYIYTLSVTNFGIPIKRPELHRRDLIPCPPG